MTLPRKRAAARGVGAGDSDASSNTADMLLSTMSCAIPRHLVPAPGVSTLAYSRLGDPRSGVRGLCSSAGSQRRPWLDRLRRALAADLFVLHYQPIVSLQDGRVSQYEALVRLADEPDGSLIAPSRFLPAAERYGLIRDIDRLVLDKVVALLASDWGSPDVSIAVNLSALSVTDAGMLAHIEGRLALHEIDPSRLVLEVTETASISDMERAAAFCARMQTLGCAVALDDFGSGFGSFGYLKRLPFRYLKIDGDFICGLPSCVNDQLVVKALVGVVQGMGAKTIAEFVGDEETIGLLRDFGVDYAQGFAIGRPRAMVPIAA
jgi:EAL domain-containing protein (putative c-di-GMP-specific phosphodiesterase class I)